MVDDAGDISTDLQTALVGLLHMAPAGLLHRSHLFDLYEA